MFTVKFSVNDLYPHKPWAKKDCKYVIRGLVSLTCIAILPIFPYIATLIERVFDMVVSKGFEICTPQSRLL